MLEHYREKVLLHFSGYNTERNDLGDIEMETVDNLIKHIGRWWDHYKIWEAKDTIKEAYDEQRLTVKGLTDFGVKPIAARLPGESETFKILKPGFREPAEGKLPDSAYYPIAKTEQSIIDRVTSANFFPHDMGVSQKTDLGLHDMSALLADPKNGLSEQQFKQSEVRGGTGVYVFMPLSHARDQLVFQNINRLAKLWRNDVPRVRTH